MKADPAAQQRLLELQAVDTGIAQINHQERNLPQIAEMDRLARELSTLEDDRVRAQVGLDDLDRDITRLDTDVQQVRDRADRDRARLADGSTPARELIALQHELASLTRRQSELEDAELELMEQRDKSQSALDGVVARTEELRVTRDGVSAEHQTALAELAARRTRLAGSREPIANAIPGDLLDLYESIRETSGIGAALLQAGLCGGCRLELSGVERARAAKLPRDEVIHCDECGRILVRTAESGL